MASLGFLEVSCFVRYLCGMAYRVCNPTEVIQKEKYGYEYYTN
jgi:hypothetical protein